MPPSSTSNPTSTPASSAEETPTSRGPGRPRQSSSDVGDVRERLLDAATELAVEQGFETCGLREIAAQAEVSPGMIAYYFGDRDGLYEAMFQRVLDRISSQVESLLDDRERSGLDRLDDIIRVQVRALAGDPWILRLIMREVLSRADSPGSQFVGDIVNRGPLQRMLKWLQDEHAKHGIPEEFDPRMLLLTIASVVGFPFLILPVIGESLGIQLDDDFPDRLIEHNQKLFSYALRAQSEKE